MTQIKEFTIASIAEPCHVKVQRGAGGRYDYEVGLHGEYMTETVVIVLAAVKQVEDELAKMDVVV